MPVLDRLMLLGSWDITLLDTIPKNVRDNLAFLGHIMILDAPIDARAINDAAMKAASRYTGVVRIKKDAFSIGGTGLLVWLGDDNGKGAIYGAAQTLVAGTFGGWITKLLPIALTAGTVTAIAGTLSNTYQWVTPRFALDHVIQTVFGGEYRVNPNFTFDAGPMSTLFPTATTPKAIALRRSSGRDTNIVGLSTTQLDLATDVEEYSTRAIVQDATGAWTFDTVIPSVPYKDGLGNAVVITRPVVSSPTPNANAQATANLQVALWNNLRQSVTLTSDEYDITRDVAAGDWIYVYDPERGLSDTTNQVHYRGSVLFPVKVRVLSVTWPIERGLGVYYRDLDGIYTDLTNFVAYEAPGVTFEVGAVQRRLT